MTKKQRQIVTVPYSLGKKPELIAQDCHTVQHATEKVVHFISP